MPNKWVSMANPTQPSHSRDGGATEAELLKSISQLWLSVLQGKPTFHTHIIHPHRKGLGITSECLLDLVEMLCYGSTTRNRINTHTPCPTLLSVAVINYDEKQLEKKRASVTYTS